MTRSLSVCVYTQYQAGSEPGRSLAVRRVGIARLSHRLGCGAGRDLADDSNRCWPLRAVGSGFLIDARIVFV